MPNPLSQAELINVAIGIEKQGIAYYDVMATSTWHEAASDLFRHLAKMEMQHIGIFQNMLDEAGDNSSPVEVTEGQRVYVQSLVDSAVFTDELAANELATHIDNEEEALDIAIGAEKDSILFYYLLSETMLPPTMEIIRKIIDEEKLHLSQLSGLKQILTNLK